MPKIEKMLKLRKFGILCKLRNCWKNNVKIKKNDMTVIVIHHIIILYYIIPTLYICRKQGKRKTRHGTAIAWHPDRVMDYE